MTPVDSTMRVVHTLFAGLWTGATLFMAALVVPAARDGRLGADGLGWLTRRFSRFSTLAIVVLLATGGHLAGRFYTFEGLGSTSQGHLVLTMVALWFVLAGVTHAASGRLTDGLDAGAEAAAANATTLFRVAGVVALALLVVAGLL